MNAQFQVAQASGTGNTNNSAQPRIFKLTKPLTDQAVVVNLGYDQKVQVDFTSIANEKITLVHVGEKLIILFDNKSTVTVEPFFDSRHDAQQNLTVEVAPGRDVSANEFASLFPITTDQSVLPAAGNGDGNSQATGAHFTDVSVDPLSVGNPLALLGQEELGNFVTQQPLAFNPPSVVILPTAGFTLSGVLLAHDESAGVQSLNGANDQSNSALPAVFSSAGLIGWAQTGVSEIASSSASFGTSGTGTITYTLSTAAGGAFSGVDSGLRATATGNEIFLFTEGNLVVGREGAGGVANAGGAIAFEIYLDPANQNLNVAQYEAIKHSVASDPDSSDGAPLADVLFVQQMVIDGVGNTASAVSSNSLGVSFLDDGPTAHADTDATAAGQFTAEGGNVLTAVGTTSPVTGIDVQGADGAVVVGVAAGNTNADADNAATLGVQIQGSYGKLTLAADGSYSYVRDAGTAGGHDDVFTYTIKDGDGDLSHTTLTISIGDSTPSDSIPAPGLAATTVYEAGLAARAGESAGSNEAANSETTTGTIGFSSPDGIQTVSLGGHALTSAAQTFTDATGSLTASYVYNAATGAGTISYAYTLLDNTSGDNTSASFAVVVTDADGDSAPAGNLVINIVDDMPTAHDDTVPQAITATTTLADLLNNDVFGADGVDITNSTPGTITVTNGDHGTVIYNDNGTFTYTPTGVFVGDDTFTYTITDGDGDTSTATVTVHVNTNTVPTGGGTVSLLVNEAALDTTLDASPAPADLAAGVVTGTNPDSRGETDQKNSGITFTATGEMITVAFADPTGGNPWVAPTVNGLAAGYHLEWHLAGSELIGSLIRDVGSLNLGDFVVLSLTNTTASPGNSVTPTVTATLVDNLLQATGLGTNDVTINGLQVVATDTSGDHVSGSVNLTVRDDVPTAFTPEQIFSEDVNHAVLSGQINFASHAGADGVGDVIFNVIEGAAVHDASGNNVFMNGEQLFYHIVDSHTIQARSSAADGSDLAFTEVLHPGTDTWDFTLNGTLFNGSEFTTQGASPSGGNNLVVGFNALSSPDTLNDLLVTANGANTVNTSTGNFGVGSGQSIGNGETIRFDFVTNESTGGTLATTHYTDHYEVTSFTQELTKTNGITSFTIKALNADNDMLFVGDGSGESIATGIHVTVTNGSGGAAPIVTHNADDTWTLTNMDKGDTFIVTATTDPFSAIEITGTGSKTFTLGPATFDTANAVHPFDVMTPIIATDGDGDPQASSVAVTLTPDSDTTQGTSGADTLTATSTFTTLLGEDGNDTLTGLDNQANLLAGGRGDDILIGGLGSDTLVGGAGNDTFVFNSTADGLDHILDFSAGDVLQFSSSAFGNLGASTLSAANFESNATGVSHQGAGTPQFVFDTANSTLYYDADGAGGSAGINMAKLENGHALTASEIHIV